MIMGLVKSIILYSININYSLPDVQCDEGEAKCANGQCITKSYVCDGGAPDCDDGSDEANCQG